jgi:hypothetical protein
MNEEFSLDDLMESIENINDTLDDNLDNLDDMVGDKEIESLFAILPEDQILAMFNNILERDNAD